MISIYLAEDQAMLNTALSQLLNLNENLSVIGTAVDGETAWTDILKLQPDVAILDIEMPKLSGLEVANRILKQKLTTQSIILTSFAQKKYFEQAVEARVSGYLLKDSDSDELVSVIKQVMDGRTVYDPVLVTEMLSSDKNPLTEREMEILEVAINGEPTKVISQKLFLSEGTVRNYLSSIFSKLGVHNRLEAIQVARKNKWIK